MSHILICGMTESGKTTLAKVMIRGSMTANIKTAVLDPLKDPSFHATFQTNDSDEFLQWAKSNESALLVIDEAGTSVGRYNPAMEWIVTTARHKGHSSVLICQGASQLSPLVRGQCSICYLFASDLSTIKTVSESFNCPEIVKLPRLKRGEFLKISRFDGVQKLAIDFKTRKITS